MRGRPHNVVVLSGGKVMSVKPKDLREFLRNVQNNSTADLSGKVLAEGLVDLDAVTAETAAELEGALFPSRQATVEPTTSTVTSDSTTTEVAAS